MTHGVPDDFVIDDKVWFQKTLAGPWYKRKGRQEKPYIPSTCDKCGKGFMRYKYNVTASCSISCAHLRKGCEHPDCNGIHGTRRDGRIIATEEMCPAYREQRNAAERERQYRLRNNNPAWVENERTRRKTEPSVYGIYFQRACLLKVGFTQFRYNAIKSAQGRAESRLGIIEIPVMIWLHPGDYRHESFIQAMLAFQFDQPPIAHRRLSEWFLVDSANVAVNALDSAYANIPVEACGYMVPPLDPG